MYLSSRLESALVTGLVFLLLFLITPDEAHGDTDMESNVSYTSVTALDFRPADHNLVYGDDDPALQYGMLWLPANLPANAHAPLVIFIHGGCWLNAFDIQHSLPSSAALADAGYAVWSIEYRRTGDAGGGWPGTFSDIRQAIAHISQLADYPVDTGQVVIAGHSAGGHLALLAGSELPAVKAVVGLAAITDIVSYSRGSNSCQKATLEFMGGDYETRPTAYHAANPAEKALHQRSVTLQGDADAIVPPAQAELRAATTKMLDGAGHFDWIHPHTEAFQLLLATLDEVFRE